MTEQELNRLIAKKQKELNGLIKECNRSRCAPYIEALLSQLRDSGNVINIICAEELNGDDCRYLGKQLCDNFAEIFCTYASSGIADRKAQRLRKSNARRARRQSKAEAAQEKTVNSAEDITDIFPELRQY